MKVHVRMTEDDFILYQKFKANAGKFRMEFSYELMKLQQEHSRLCMTLLQGIEMDDCGCRIVNDNLVSRAMEMGLSYQQKQ